MTDLIPGSEYVYIFGIKRGGKLLLYMLFMGDQPLQVNVRCNASLLGKVVTLQIQAKHLAVRVSLEIAIPSQ